MQVFEVSEIESHPYMETKEVFADTVQELLDESRVLILIDHDDKKIWTYYGMKSPLKLQLFGGILAKKFRVQLRLFYRVVNFNELPMDNKAIKNLLEKKIGPGRAKEINSENYENFSIPGENVEKLVDLSVHKGLKKRDAIEYAESIPPIENFKTKYLIIAGSFYIYDSEVEKFVTSRDEKKKIKKVGDMPNGFYIDDSHDYSIRFSIKNNMIQCIEYYVPREEPVQTEKLDVPIFFEERFQKPGDINDVLNSFDIPEDKAGKASGEVSDTDGE